MSAVATKLNKRILIQSRVPGQDGAGQPSTSWQNFFTDGDGKIWASIEDLSGREYIAASATQNKVTTKIIIRHHSGITAAMRVLYGTDAYNIEATLGQDNRTLLLMCSRMT